MSDEAERIRRAQEEFEAWAAQRRGESYIAKVEAERRAGVYAEIGRNIEALDPPFKYPPRVRVDQPVGEIGGGPDPERRIVPDVNDPVRDASAFGGGGGWSPELTRPAAPEGGDGMIGMGSGGPLEEGGPPQPAPPPPPPPAGSKRPAIASFGFEAPRNYTNAQRFAAAMPVEAGPEARLFEIAGAIFDETLYVENFNYQEAARSVTIDRMIKQVYEATGVELEHPLRDLRSEDAYPGFSPGQYFQPTNRAPVGEWGMENLRSRRLSAFETAIADLRAKHPDKADRLPALSLEEATRAFQREISARADDVRTRSVGGIEAFVGELGGGLGGSFGDPSQIMTLPIGFGSRTILGAVVKEAAVNAGIVGALEWSRDKEAWTDITGREYTMDDFFSRVGTAAAFGGVIGGGGKFLQQGAGRVFGDRESFEVFRKKYDALPPDHPFRIDETFQRAVTSAQRSFDDAVVPEGLTPEQHSEKLAEAKLRAAAPEAFEATDPPPPPPIDGSAPPAAGGTLFDLDVDPAIVRAAEDPTDANLDAAAEKIEAEFAPAADDAEVAYSFGQRVWHGSPHVFDRFEWNAERAGTGEGSQAFGWGLYFAQNKRVASRYHQQQGDVVRLDGRSLDPRNPSDVAGKYLVRHGGKVAKAAEELKHWTRDGLPRRRKFYKAALEQLLAGRATPARYYSEGGIYEVELRLDDEIELLDLDMPLREQPEEVQAATRAAATAWANAQGDNLSRPVVERRLSYMTGYDIIQLMGNNKAASDLLAAQGLKGTRFFDGFSRMAQKGERNYVIFNADDVALIARNGEPVAPGPIEAGVSYSYGGVTVRTPKFDGPAELRRLLGEPSTYRPWQDNPDFAARAATAGESVQTVPVAAIVAGQPQIRHNFRDIPARYGDTDAELPWLVKEGGRYFIRDGTHRIAAQVDAGAQSVRARVIDLDKPPTAAGIEAEAVAAFGALPPGVKIGPAPEGVPDGAVAMTDKRTGEVTLFEGRIAQGEVGGVILHEIGAHAGIEAMVGAKDWADLLAFVQLRAEKNEGAWAGVLDAIPFDTPPHLRVEEALGYFLEKNAGNPELVARERWWQRLLQAVRDWAAKALPWLKRELTDRDVMDLARGAVQRRIDDGRRELELSPDERVFTSGQPDDLGFITSAERALADPPGRFRDAKALKPDQWRKLFREGGATKEAFTWQIEPALKALADEGMAGDIPRAKMEEALARSRGTLRVPPEKSEVFGPTGVRMMDRTEADYSAYVAPGHAKNYQQEVLLLPPEQGQGYKSHNWASKDVVGHIRTTDRVAADGAKVRHVEELQSDLHQEGAKYGYSDGGAKLSIAEALAQFYKKRDDYDAWVRKNENALTKSGLYGEVPYFVPTMTAMRNPSTGLLETFTTDKIVDPVGRELLREARAAFDRVDEASGGGHPPRAPLESWEEPFVRHALQQAAADGIDTVTFPTHATLHSALKNEGTKKFYDERLPNTLARVAKSLGLKVEAVGIVFGDLPSGSVANRVRQFNRQGADGLGQQTVPAIRLTPEAKAKLAEGVVMYSHGSPTGRAQPAPAGTAAANPKQASPGNPNPAAGPPSPQLARQRWLAALNKQAERRVGRALVEFRNGSGNRDAGEFLQAIFDYHGQGNLPAEMSMDPLRRGIIAETLSEMDAALNHFRSGTGGRRLNKADLDNFVKEMFGEDTKDAAAKAMAQAVQASLEKLRVRFNAAGGQIGKLERWGLPQHHNRLALDKWIERQDKKLGAGRGHAALKQRLFDSLDISRMRDVHTGKPMTAQAVWDALDDVIEDMRTDGWATRTPSRQAVGGGSIASRRAEHRFLIFRDAETWMAWQRDFGAGDPVMGIVAHVEGMARDIAAMEVLGPNPESMITWLQGKAQAEAAARKMGRPAALPDRFKGRAAEQYVREKIARMNSMWENYTGEINVPVTEWKAKLGANVRNVITSSTLGGAILSAVPTDPVFQAMARHFAGASHGKALKMMATAFKDPKRARQLQLIMDHTLSAFGTDARQAGFFGGTGWSAVLANQTIAMQGLSVWTRWGRTAFGMGMLADLGEAAGTKWGDLHKPLQRFLARYGFSEGDWDAIRASQLTPEGFLDPAQIRVTAGRRLMDRLKSAIMSETEYAVPSGTLRTRSLINFGTRPGTTIGEIVRSGRMFTSFAATIPMLYGYRMWHQLNSGNKLKGAMYAASMIAGLTLGGAVAMQMKALASGKDAQSWDDPLGRDQEFWKAAFLQGGGLGIYGDFLFGDLNRMDRGLEQTLAGPAVTMAGDLIELTFGNLNQALSGEDSKAGKEWADFLTRNVPGSNIWYLRNAYDRWIEDGLRFAVDPEAEESFRRKVKDLKRNTGQGYFWAPGTAAPQRGPVVSEAPPPKEAVN